ncbi:MAG: alpha/beta hydrolase [Chitinophagaceae bacterium]|nr:alpha/beta hydrolase [Chitinophagaceae bacterium]MBL0335950.1 alpha/beta hydrolase [Chitinophagaceae bacterium]
MTQYFIIPGLGNSGPDHWQSYFESSGSNFIRVNQQEWDAPSCEDWINTLENTLSQYDLSNAVLIGHSLGCMTIVHWATRFKKKIKGALLVAPSDPEADVYTFPATGFAPVPLNVLSFDSIVVASANDVWVTIERAEYFAESWGSEFINIGDAGHINVASGHTQWSEGLKLLDLLEK